MSSDNTLQGSYSTEERIGGRRRMHDDATHSRVNPLALRFERLDDAHVCRIDAAREQAPDERRRQQDPPPVPLPHRPHLILSSLGCPSNEGCCA